MFLNPEYPLDLFTKYFVILLLRYFIVAGLVYFIFWKWLKPRLAKSKIHGFALRPGQISKEIKYSIFTSFIFTFGGFYLFYLNAYHIGFFYRDISEYGWPYFFFSIVLVFLIHDVYFYWSHRLSHHPWCFKKFHHVHHESHNTTPWTSLFLHPVDAVINVAFIFALPWMIPLHIKVVPIFAAGSFLYNVYGHSGYDFVPRQWISRPLFNWILPSLYHSLHHEKVVGNYGLYFSWWDRWCGTLRVPTNKT